MTALALALRPPPPRWSPPSPAGRRRGSSPGSTARSPRPARPCGAKSGHAGSRSGWLVVGRLATDNVRRDDTAATLGYRFGATVARKTAKSTASLNRCGIADAIGADKLASSRHALEQVGPAASHWLWRKRRIVGYQGLLSRSTSASRAPFAGRPRPVCPGRRPGGRWRCRW